MCLLILETGLVSIFEIGEIKRRGREKKEVIIADNLQIIQIIYFINLF